MHQIHYMYSCYLQVKKKVDNSKHLINDGKYVSYTQHVITKRSEI